MKKLLFIFTVFFSIIFSGCKKTENTSIDTSLSIPAKFNLTAENMANIEGVKNLPNQDLKRIAFRLLSPIEKYGAWAENARLVSANFTPEQKRITIEFINFLSPKLFDNPDHGQVASFRDEWLIKAKNVFTYEQIRALAFKLFDTTDTKNLQINSEYGGGEKRDCNCNAGSQFSCAGDSACYPPDEMWSCTNSTNWGCGFAGLWPCNNLCIVLPPIPAE